MGQRSLPNVIAPIAQYDNLVVIRNGWVQKPELQRSGHGLTGYDLDQASRVDFCERSEPKPRGGAIPRLQTRYFISRFGVVVGDCTIVMFTGQPDQIDASSNGNKR
ncbi:hypothetical protein GCM10010971_01220 [Silvimonas amylolytica]|uniref:Uncharacterized protein n=1 Tax=Silvimonas amylolytica TaxID=449663 RepID=A0ABQ2PG95_9NEIS|nr:hypothetical protein GCM10010971_01220 [Silvimonas amylolytica]